MNKVLIKKYYQLGIYKDEHLDVFVRAGYITETEMKAIQEG
ncbi:MAG: XkdX family protein [Clostridia bacterium]|nr:XkdX family protein [Clostridia bacterium]